MSGSVHLDLPCPLRAFEGDVSLSVEDGHAMQADGDVSGGDTLFERVRAWVASTGFRGFLPGDSTLGLVHFCGSGIQSWFGVGRRPTPLRRSGGFFDGHFCHPRLDGSGRRVQEGVVVRRGVPGRVRLSLNREETGIAQFVEILAFSVIWRNFGR